MEGVWKDLRGFVGLPVEDLQETTKFADQFERLANQDEAARPAQAGGAKRRVQAKTGASGTTPMLLRPNVAREHLPMNSLIGGGIRLVWLAVRGPTSSCMREVVSARQFRVWVVALNRPHACPSRSSRWRWRCCWAAPRARAAWRCVATSRTGS
jgi:hypothetical protein